jgi:leucyl aminopeptidase
MLTVRLDAAPPEHVAADLVALALTADDLRVRAVQRRLAALGGRRLDEELARRRFRAAEGSALVVGPLAIRARGRGARSAPTLVLIGLGSAAAPSRDAWRRAADQVIVRSRDLGARSATLGPARAALLSAETVGTLAEAATLASYAFTTYRADRDRTRLRRLVLAGADGRARPMTAAVRRGVALGRATNAARTWINTPASVLTPAVFADEVRRAAKSAGLAVTVDGPAAITKLGMGALLGVARGSVEEPRFIRLTYTPSGTPRRRLALVGKGVTFDSGGLSLKTADGMEHMKRDMAGAAAVVGAMIAIATLRPDVEVRAYVPAAENMPSGSAIKPGDVVRTASGKTIEVLNTDAEGRLLLADALAIAVRDQPDAIVDIATLTGAIRVALGTRIAGVMGNDTELVRALRAAAERSGERIWELPLVEAYRADLTSGVADLRNVAAEGHGGAIHAGLMLREFVDGRPWAHLDIAGVAFTDRDLPCTPRGGVGWGVRLLTEWAVSS